MWTVKVWLVLGVCAWILAPAAGAQRELPPLPFARQQWRIFPHSPLRRGVDEEINARFARQIELLGSFFQPDESSSPSEPLADSFLEAKVRNQLFRLESLLRLYRKAFPDLEKYLASVKEIEDAVGDYSYAVDSLKFAEEQFKTEDRRQGPNAARVAEQQKVLAGLRKKQEKARIVFANVIERSTLRSDLLELQSQVSSNLVGWRPGQDLEYVNGELRQVLKDARDGRYDFLKLEDGIH